MLCELKHLLDGLCDVFEFSPNSRLGIKVLSEFRDLT
jgi:hypothetical protein